MQLRKHRLDSVRAGFTLMEVMVVMAIIVILAGIGGVMYMRYLEDARRDRARIDVQMLTGAVQNYSVKYGDYPTSLASLLQPPWGREYHYQYPGQRNAASGKPDIWSDGPTVADAGGVIGNW